MTTLSVSDVQKAVRSLPATEFSVFSEWFDTYEQARWDDRLASDQQTSPALLSAIEEAKTDFRDGQCTSL
ncbi:MAG: hypothetical protein PHV28_18980 [Kiritimatiellae bacterium]|nr:hypothetical protein [Kiritimatiellia bacterium]